MSTNQFLECQIHGTIAAGGSNARPTVNTFHYNVAGGATLPVTKAQIDAAFQALVAVPLAAALSIRWTQVSNTIRFLDDATDPPVAFLHALPGAIVGDSMPMTNTVYMLQRSQFKGKRYRGNKKFGPIAESDTTTGTDDTLNVAALVRWNALAAALTATMVDAATNNWYPCVISRQPPAQYKINPTNVQSVLIFSTLVRKTIGRLRRRTAKPVY